jgi:hypothetical protein
MGVKGLRGRGGVVKKEKVIEAGKGEGGGI